MSFHAEGDSRKMICSTDDEEGYENNTFHQSRIPEFWSQINIRSKRDFYSGVYGEVPPIPTPPISDDADRSFWAEDELSSSESRQRINLKQKRRHSLSYRNRIAIHRSRSLLFQSTSSSSDCVRLKIQSAVQERERFRRPVKRSQIGQLKLRKKTEAKEWPSTSFKSTSSTINKKCSVEFPNSISQQLSQNICSTSSSSNHSRNDVKKGMISDIRKKSNKRL